MNEAAAVMDLHLDLGSAALDLRLPVPASAAPLREMLPALHELSSQFIRIGVEGMAGQGQQVSCRAGCGACCRQLVPIAPAEAHALRALVDELPAERRVLVRERFEAAIATLDAAGFGARFAAAAEGGPGEFQAVIESYFRLRIACPFLEAESCSIHAARPVACREYLVTSPPSLCASASGKGVDNVVHLFKVKEALLALDGEHQPAGPAGFVPMIEALRWADDHPETSPALEPRVWFDRLFRRLQALL